MTAECGVSDVLADHIATMRPCPVGLEVPDDRSRRAAVADLVTEIGSGPDGSSLTDYYQRSRGGGAEKRCTIYQYVLATSSVPSTPF